MRERKLKEFAYILEQNRSISFYLYNVKYTININNKKFAISNNGSNLEKIYFSITDLFSNYMIYGESLAESFDDIILSND